MQILIVLSLALVAAWLAYSRWTTSSESRRRKHPPGPPRLPIFGNIFQVGPNPHKSFTRLAKTYGPLMSLQLGNQFVLVASSPEMATEVLQKQGLVFARPFNPVALRVHGHHQNSVAMLPSSNDTWKKLRRILREKLFSPQALQASQGVRQERLRRLTDHVSRSSGAAMNVGEATFTAMSNIMFATLFSTDYSDVAGPDGNRKFREDVSEYTKYIGIPNVADFFSIFAPLDPQGIRRKLIYHLGGLLEVVEAMIERRMEARKGSDYQKQNDFVETLLDLMEGHEYDLNMDEVKHLLVDLLVGGSDTSAATTEWTMVELLLHPDKMAKLRAELKTVLGDKTMVEESDISRLPYLQATVKEVFRYHPVAPLLAPHSAEEETQLNGYIIPKDTKIIVNNWAITRDPTVWKNPDSFEPERFLDNSDIDYKGHHFELIPFSSGRRICPGIPLAGRMLHCMVGTLCHNFDWRLERGNESKELQREDVFGLALHKKNPFWAIPHKV